VVFLLREAFAFEYQEIAKIVDRSQETCRQILKRARSRIRAQACSSPAPEPQRVVAAFREAVDTGEMGALSQHFGTAAPDRAKST
jgi:RNA polymerase sigma-70 factor (ECF subfamily)